MVILCKNQLINLLFLHQFAEDMKPSECRSDTSAETCGLDDEFPPDDLGSRPEALW